MWSNLNIFFMAPCITQNLNKMKIILQFLWIKLWRNNIYKRWEYLSEKIQKKRFSELFLLVNYRYCLRIWNFVPLKLPWYLILNMSTLECSFKRSYDIFFCIEKIVLLRFFSNFLLSNLNSLKSSQNRQ